MEEQKEENVMSPVAGIISLLTYVFIGFLIAQLVAAILVLPFMIDFNDPQAIMGKLNNMIEYPELRLPLLMMQAISSIVTFIAVPIFYMRTYKISFDDLTGRFIEVKPILLLSVVIMVFSVFPFLSFLIEWNMSWVFPSGFQEWAVSQEEQMKVMTEYLLKMDGILDLLLVFIVVAIIPGIGEELLFRGLLQTQLSFAIKNMHVVIWLTAFIFAAIHMQFFGLVPRMLLGAMFGYIFYWSGSLKYSMLAHIVNNGFQVVATYILASNGSDYNLDDDTSFPIYMVGISLITTGALMFYLKQNFDKSEVADSL